MSNLLLFFLSIIELYSTVCSYICYCVILVIRWFVVPYTVFIYTTPALGFSMKMQHILWWALPLSMLVAHAPSKEACVSFSNKHKHSLNAFDKINKDCPWHTLKDSWWCPLGLFTSVQFLRAMVKGVDSNIRLTNVVTLESWSHFAPVEPKI